MDKLFEALSRTKSEIIDGYLTGNLWVGMTPEELDAIKQALLELQAIKEAKPSEALEDLKELHELAYGADGWKIDDIVQSLHIKQALLKAEKLEKAIKIIRNKKVDIDVLCVCENVEKYNKLINSKIFASLTEQEFELLKEILA